MKGGLMSHGASLVDSDRGIAIYVDKIVKGTKPADLPVEQQTKFELVINRVTTASSNGAFSFSFSDVPANN